MFILHLIVPFAANMKVALERAHFIAGCGRVSGTLLARSRLWLGSGVLPLQGSADAVGARAMMKEFGRHMKERA
ncbi:MAG: hypothetical protein JOY60_13205 [Burkholderiaceae bacterium]|nr:hypothetical protein [Burkholderiaceae bacterium]